MKLFYRSIICLPVLFGVLFNGCIGERQFSGKNKHLKTSRRVGYGNRSFSDHPCIKFDFSSEEKIKNFRIVNGGWQIDDGKLWAVIGERNRSILLAKNVKAPFRIEFEATNYANEDNSIGDITVLINSENSDKFFSRGYALTTGSYYNNCTTFYRLGKPIAKTEYSPLVSGETYRVMIEFIDGHIRYWLNEKIILEVWDSKPLEMEPDLWIGIRTWNTKMAVDNFNIYQVSGKQEENK